VNSLLITSGCGNWCHNWFAARNFIIDTHWLFDEIIVLPTSFELPQIDNLDHKITYFARDKFTSLDTIKNAQFCHDMAFFLEITDLDLSASNRDGYFFRIDKEKSSQQPPVPKSSFDLSAISHDRQNVVPFFKILSAYKTITTDRLHIAIAASLMGKETQLYMGSYFKSKDVYYSSIESNYPNTKFIPYD
jgi:exopolysaccharide biosynthesis predicted pyruvyltransferase EpsI